MGQNITQKWQKTWILAKNWPICPVRAPSAGGKNFFELSCRLGSVRNMVRSKICANQENRTRHPDPNQENINFPHFSPEFLRNKFENFFKNSYRTIVLTNSSKEVPKFFIKGENYKNTTEKLTSFPFLWNILSIWCETLVEMSSLRARFLWNGSEFIHYSPFLRRKSPKCHPIWFISIKTN